MKFKITVDDHDDNRLHVVPVSRSRKDFAGLAQNMGLALKTKGTVAQRRNVVTITHVLTVLDFWRETTEGKWLVPFEDTEVLVGGRQVEVGVRISVVFNDHDVRKAFKAEFGI